jgi:hypothetical protein
LEGLVNKLLAALLLYGMKDPFQFGWWYGGPQGSDIFASRNLWLNSFFLEESWYLRSEGLLVSICDSGLLLTYDRDVV